MGAELLSWERGAGVGGGTEIYRNTGYASCKIDSYRPRTLSTGYVTARCGELMLSKAAET